MLFSISINLFINSLLKFRMELILVSIRNILLGIVALFLLILGCNDSDSPVASAVEDRTPPIIWWTAPEAGATVMDTVLLRLEYIDEVEVDSVILVKDGAIIATYQLQNANGQVDYMWNTLSDSDGVHIWEARAWDDSGNMVQSLSLLACKSSQPTRPTI
jgi:hypothetical protein